MTEEESAAFMEVTERGAVPGGIVIISLKDCNKFVHGRQKFRVAKAD